MVISILVLIYLFIFVSEIRLVKNGYNNSYLSKEMSLNIRGFAELLIILHHISQAIDIPVIFVFLRYIGFIVVAVFFFLSGYGLKVSLNTKPHYFDGFLLKHFSSILIPYWLLAILRVIVHFFRNTHLTFMDIFYFFFAIHEMWFVLAILIFYSCFWIAYKYFNKSFRVLCFELAIYTLICLKIGVDSWWTASTLAFPMGVLWEDHKFLFEGKLHKNFSAILLSSSLLFLILFLGRLVIMSSGFTNPVLHCFVRNITSCSFVFLILVICQKISVRKGFLFYAGKLSLELYISHGAFIFLAKENMILFWIITIVSSFIIHFSYKRIRDNYSKMIN